MSIEAADYISQLIDSNPAGTDKYSTADNHLRLIKKVLTQSFPNVSGVVSATAAAINNIQGAAGNIQTQIDTVNVSIASTSADIASQISSASASFASDISSVSVTLNSDIRSVSATLASAKLGASSTAVAALTWRTHSIYVQTATPTVAVDGIWFME